MKKILITGATGNAGCSLIGFLCRLSIEYQVFAGVRDIGSAKKIFAKYQDLQLRNFDFENRETFEEAFVNIDTVFLLRPPHISDTETYFRPLLKAMRAQGVKEVLFLSVQGAEKSKIIPHNKIEKLIIDFGFKYIFLRPSYFMQNLTTTLLADIQKYRKIILPAGKAKFNWVDVENIGESAAYLLANFKECSNKSIELTGNENLNFYEVADQLNQYTDNKIDYVSPNIISFYRIKRKQGMRKGMIMVMIMLHFLPRFQNEPKISNFYEQIFGKEPTRLWQFIEREKAIFEKPKED